jgi:hypothetical protein
LPYKKTFCLTHGVVERAHVKNEKDNGDDIVAVVLCKQAADSKTMSMQSFAAACHCKSALYVYTGQADYK